MVVSQRILVKLYFYTCNYVYFWFILKSHFTNKPIQKDKMNHNYYKEEEEKKNKKKEEKKEPNTPKNQRT